MDRAGGWNFVANVFDGALYFLALTLISQQAVLPVFVRNIGGGNVALGMIPVVWTFGFNFPQVVIAPHAQMLRRKKPLLLQTAIGQRIPWLLLGIFALFLIRHVGTDLALALFFILFALAAIGGSLNLPVWFDLIAKLTPVGARGRLFAARLVGGAVLGLGGGALVTHTLEAYGWPENFAFLFFGAFAIMMVSYLFLVSLRGESDDIPPRQRADWRVLLSVPRRLGMRGNYLRYLVADALLSASAMANAFFAIYALKKFALPDWYAGTFTLAMMASTILGGGIFGVVADRYGHRINMIMFALLSVL
ncbi:MAG TPA: MFS transporter, partial [Bacteroidota bacterium]|nr:MFS transporter [Bacteroidota bacterium]